MQAQPSASVTMGGVVSREWWTYGAQWAELGNPNITASSHRRCNGGSGAPQPLAYGSVNTKKVGVGVTLHISGSVAQYCAGDPNCGGPGQSFPFELTKPGV